MHLKHILKIPFRRGYLNANKIKTTRKGMNAIKQIRKEHKLYLKHILMINGIVLVSASVVLLSTKTLDFSKNELEITWKPGPGAKGHGGPYPPPMTSNNTYMFLFCTRKSVYPIFIPKKRLCPPP